MTPPDDRSGGSLHVRAKVILAHTSWLLQQRGLRELGGMRIGDDGFTQKFETPSGVHAEVAASATEPVKVAVVVHTRPPSRYVVKADGEDGKTVDVSVLSSRIAAGIGHLSLALQRGSPQAAPARPEDRMMVPRTDVRMPARGVASARKTRTFPATGTVANRSEGRLRSGPEQGASPEDEERPAALRQLVADLATIAERLRLTRFGGPLVREVEAALGAAKRGDAAAAAAAVGRARAAAGQASGDGQAALAGVTKALGAALAWIRWVTDGRRERQGSEGEKTGAVARLRAVAKPESAHLGRGVGMQRFVAPRNREVRRGRGA